MMELPPLVSKGSPIRASDQNKLINAVRHLAAGSVARSGGAGMLRSRAAGKKHPFEVSVYYDAATSSVVASVEPGVWHGNRATVPAGIVAADTGVDGTDADTWIVGEYDTDSGGYKATEISVPAPGYIFLFATLTDGKVDGVTVGFSPEAPSANSDGSGVIETVVAYINFARTENGITDLTVLQYLNGDFWLGEKGGSGESYAGNPFAWTKVGENTWQLRKVALMVTPHQIYGTNGVSGVNVMYSGPGDVFTPTRSDSVGNYDTAPFAENSYATKDGLCVRAELEDDRAVLVYAEVDGERTLSWRVHNVYDVFGGGGTEGAPFPLPWVPQQMTAAFTFDVKTASAGTNAISVTYRLEGNFNDAPVANFRVSVPMAIIARNAGKTSLVPIRHGMIEVRPALALGFRMELGSEFAETAIDRNDIAGSWDISGVTQEDFVE
ncbi:MAG: hypothetical protein J6L64_07780 [Opitutales bacterium]|nr:hypothetical protein [Opitutales bacterium]